MKKQVPLRLEESLYKALRVELLKDGKSFQEYVEELIKADMEKRNIKC